MGQLSYCRGGEESKQRARLKSASPLHLSSGCTKFHSTVFKITHKLDQSSEQFRVLLTEQQNPSVDRSDTDFSESTFILYRAKIPLSAELFPESAAGGIVNFCWASLPGAEAAAPMPGQTADRKAELLGSDSGHECSLCLLMLSHNEYEWLSLAQFYPFTRLNCLFFVIIFMSN